jgi:hypothetical protein
MAVTLWQAEFYHNRPLVERINTQTERRVLHGEAVAASEKLWTDTASNRPWDGADPSAVRVPISNPRIARGCALQRELPRFSFPYSSVSASIR